MDAPASPLPDNTAHDNTAHDNTAHDNTAHDNTAHDNTAHDGLNALRSVTREPMDHVECFPAPPSCTRVTFTTDEVTSMCPVTGQPDWSSVRIEYEPHQWCVESKSLKLFLWSFRDQQIFAEALAAAIAAEIQRAARPRHTRVVVTQHVRGGIVTEATAELGSAD